jgi:hypothetical protein
MKEHTLTGPVEHAAQTTDTTLGDDLLYGRAAIASFLKMPPRRVESLLKENRLPVGRLGHTVIGSKARLRAMVDALFEESAA